MVKVCSVYAIRHFSVGKTCRTKREGAARCVILVGAIMSLSGLLALGQAHGSVDGRIFDPSGAVVIGAEVMLTRDQFVLTSHSSNDGAYDFNQVPTGHYKIAVTMAGFAPFTTDIAIAATKNQNLNVSLSIAVQRQDLTVTDQTLGGSVNPEENASAMVINGSDLDALSDDPDELQNQLQALAGPEAGPNGGQIYIDGYSGGQIPPKSSIREIRVNQNPFSAEFDRIGYGRIEILTKPGAQKFSGTVTSMASDSSWNTKNPLVQQQPDYYSYQAQASVNGPLTKQGSYFFNLLRLNRQSQTVIDAIDPANITTNIREALPNPFSLLSASPRIDVQLGDNNTLSVRDSFNRSVATGNGPGQLALADQAFNLINLENDIQLSDAVVISSHLINETRFQWRRVRNDEIPCNFTPTVTVQGAFTAGGNNSGIIRDHQDIFELQNYSTAAMGRHVMRFGTRLRAYRDANYSTSGSNGNYFFASTGQYVTSLPVKYQQTLIVNPLAKVLMFDGSAFIQDDWRWKSNLTLSGGLRFETQNRIQDHGDLAPRLAIAWAPTHKGSKPSGTVIRAGYGWFYGRFTVPNSSGSSTNTPFIVQSIHQNGINQKSYIINNPDFYYPNAPVPTAFLASASTSIPSFYSVDRRFHTALDMQGGLGVDQKVGKVETFNVTYLYTRGVHQYLTNTVTAPQFDPSSYLVVGPPPDVYNYQFQSNGIYKQHQVIVTSTTRLRHLSLRGSYTFNVANSDTQGVTYVPSVAQDPSLDYGRANFGIKNRFLLLGTYTARYGIVIAPLFTAQSGTPYNLVIGSDLTENNQFNARPTYGRCGATDVISTPYGCLDTSPVGKGEKVVPYGLGLGPANVVLHMRVSKVIGIGPKREEVGGAPAMQAGSSMNGRGLSGGQAQLKLDASAPRKYSLTFVGGALNALNIVNLGTPNGILNSPLFGKAQSLAGGSFASPTSGNRTVFLQASFNF